jgi:hypothetical protein
VLKRAEEAISIEPASRGPRFELVRVGDVAFLLEAADF